MKTYYLGIFSLLTLFCGGCGSAPLHGTFVSDEKNMWVEDLAGNGLSYCMANPEGAKADPVCFSARKATAVERAAASSNPSSSTSPNSSPTK